MQDLQKQLNLLNDYVRTLERQNQSKSNQIQTLTQQNDQLIQQCEALRSKARHSTTIVNNSSSSTSLQVTVQKLENQLKQSKAAYILLLQQSQQGNQTQRLRQDVRRLTQQKLILHQYKQKLQKQLRQLGFKNIQSYVGKMKQLEYQLQDSNKRIKVYETKIVDYERKVTLFSNQITIKSSQLQRLNDKVRSLTENNSQTTFNKSNELKIEEYEKKITQISSQLTINRSQIQRLKQKESQFVIIQRQNQSLKRQVQNLTMRISSSSTSSTQISSLNTQISSYQVTINSLKSEQKDWERQRQQLQIKISDLQSDLIQKSNLVAQLRLREQFLKSKQAGDSLTQKEIQNLNNIIRILKIQIQDHKRTISYRDSTIKTLQTKINSSDLSKSSQISNIQRIVEQKNSQINRLIESHNQKNTLLSLQIERYKSISISNTQGANQLASLREENGFLKRQSQNNQLLIQQLQRQKEGLKLRIKETQEQLYRSKTNHSQVRTFVTKNDTGEHQLTKIVRELRDQLEEVKKSNVVIHEENYHMQKYLTQISESQIQIPHFGNESSIMRFHSPHNATSFHQHMNSPSQLRLNLQNESSMRQSKHYRPAYFKSQMNIEKKRQQRNDRSTMSPVRDVKSPPAIGNNKQKWQSLQRKISALRVENDQLKRTLLYE